VAARPAAAGAIGIWAPTSFNSSWLLLSPHVKSCYANHELEIKRKGKERKEKIFLERFDITILKKSRFSLELRI
jgi:hypothetical protein